MTHGLPLVGAWCSSRRRAHLGASLEGFATARGGDQVLFFSGDPVRFPLRRWTWPWCCPNCAPPSRPLRGRRGERDDEDAVAPLRRPALAFAGVLARRQIRRQRRPACADWDEYQRDVAHRPRHRADARADRHSVVTTPRAFAATERGTSWQHDAARLPGPHRAHRPGQPARRGKDYCPCRATWHLPAAGAARSPRRWPRTAARLRRCRCAGGAAARARANGRPHRAWTTWRRRPRARQPGAGEGEVAA